MAKKSSKKARKSSAAGKPANQPPAINVAEEPQRSSAPPRPGEAVVEAPREVAPVADAAPAQPPPHLLTPLAEVWPTPKAGAEPSKPVQGSSASEIAPAPAAPACVKVSFFLLDLGAKQVSVCGDFNGWAPGAAPMKRDAKGLWSATLDLAPGRYQYKFVVDGQWIPDPRARDQVWNCHGTLNSLIEVPA